MSESEELKQEKNRKWYKATKPGALFLGLLVIAVGLISIRGVRIWICDITQICYWTCEEYSKGNIINVMPPEVGMSCEDVELLKQKELEENIRALFGITGNQIYNATDTMHFSINKSDTEESK